jgi:hypothetical protein
MAKICRQAKYMYGSQVEQNWILINLELKYIFCFANFFRIFFVKSFYKHDYQDYFEYTQFIDEYNHRSK